VIWFHPSVHLSIHPFIHPLIHGLSACRCPFSSSLGEFPDYWDWLWCPELSPVWVSIAFSLRLLYLGVFPFTSFTCHWISFVFLFYDWCICTYRTTLHLRTCWWVSRLGTISGTRYCGPRGGAEVGMKQKSLFKFLSWSVFESRTLQPVGRERYH